MRRAGLLGLSGVLVLLLALATACGGDEGRADQTLPPMLTTTTTTTMPTTTTEYIPIVYIVQPGDGLKQIANSFGVDYEELLLRNGISDPNKLFAGQELVIPPSTLAIVVDTFPTTTTSTTTSTTTTLVLLNP